MKKLVFFIILSLFCLNTFAAISDLKVSPYVRLGENITISGTYSTADVLCMFLILDANGVIIERLSDEYTFADGSFYSERVLIEPTYFRGDTYDVRVTCYSDTDTNSFTVLQPLSIVHPVQKGWEYWFSEGNQDAIMIFGTAIAGIILAILLAAFIIKKGRSYAG